MLLFLAERCCAVWPSLAGGQALDLAAPRALLAVAVAFLLALASGPNVIAWLRRHCGEPVHKTASPTLAALHAAKQNTPTMGGLFLVGGVLATMFVCGDWSSPLLWIAALFTLALTALGACDDVIKLRTARRGLSARAKLLAQAAIALVAALLVYRLHLEAGTPLDLRLPGMATMTLGWGFVPLAVLVIVGASNAVNLTDGLDGLAAGSLGCACGALAIASYVSGSETWAARLGITYVTAARETTVLSAALVGGLAAFLRFNRHPAVVFLGNTGSLPLGGLLGLVAVVCRQELLLVVIGGVFVAEAASVIVQVAWFRWCGRRVFLCAPLHHHFQFRGWHERQIVARFWVASGLCALLGLACLGLQAREPAPITQTPSGAQPPAARLVQEPAAVAELF